MSERPPHEWFASSPPPPPGPPAVAEAQPQFQPTQPPLTARAAAALTARLLIPAAFGLGVALYLLLRRDYDALVGLEMLLVPLVGAAVALVARRGPAEALGWAAVSALSAGGTAVIVAPVLIFFDFLDCWFSWLSDC